MTGMTIEQAINNLDQASASIQGTRQVHEALLLSLQTVREHVADRAFLVEQRRLWETRAGVLKEALRALDPQNRLVSDYPALEDGFPAVQ